MTRNYPTPQGVVYYHHPIADWFRNLPHGGYVVQMCTKCCYSVPAVTFIKALQYTTGKHLLLLSYLQYIQLNPWMNQAKYEDQRFLLTIYVLIFHSSNFYLATFCPLTLEAPLCPPLSKEVTWCLTYFEKLPFDSFNCIRQRDQHTYLGIHLCLSGMCIWFLINIDDI